jgi:hypothetical protein
MDQVAQSVGHPLGIARKGDVSTAPPSDSRKEPYVDVLRAKNVHADVPRAKNIRRYKNFLKIKLMNMELTFLRRISQTV